MSEAMKFSPSPSPRTSGDWRFWLQPVYPARSRTLRRSKNEPCSSDTARAHGRSQSFLFLEPLFDQMGNQLGIGFGLRLTAANNISRKVT